MVLFINDKIEKQKIAKEILSKLPEWFGIPESTQEYIDNCIDMPFWIEKEDNIIKGFITLKETSIYTAEIYVMGVLKNYHNNGIGKMLFNAFYNYAKQHNYEFIQVKTVKQGVYDIYDITNKFYKNLGFKELECFPTLWDKSNPCQIYIKSIV